MSQEPKIQVESALARSGGGRDDLMRSADRILFRLVVVFVLAIVLTLLWKIVSTEFPDSGSDSAALVQLTQWTIATVLTGGAALVGLNWYQASRRYEDDQEKRNRSVSDVEIRLVNALKERDETIARLSAQMESEIEHELRRLERKYFTVGSEYGSFASFLTEYPITSRSPLQALKSSSRIILERLQKEVAGENYVYFGQSDIEKIREAVAHIAVQLPAEAQAIEKALEVVVLSKRRQEIELEQQQQELG